MAIDLSFFSSIHKFAGLSKALDWLMIFFADYLAYILVFVLAGLLWRLGYDFKRRLYYFAYVFLAALIARGVIVELINVIYPRPRPFLRFDFEPLIAPIASPSFPSGHASVFFALAFSLFFLARKVTAPWFTGSLEAAVTAERGRRLREASLWFTLAAIMMGLGRVFVGVHFPIDILGGAAAGIISVLIANQLLSFQSK